MGASPRSSISALLAFVLTAVTLFGAAARAATVTMNLAWDTPMNSEYGIIAKKFQSLVDAYSHGAIEVHLHCCGQLGSEDHAFTALQLGTVDAYIITANNVTTHWPLMNLTVLPYVFHSPDDFLKIIHGPIGNKLKSMIRKQTGVYLLTWGAPSYRDAYTTNRPVHSIKDFKGLKYRVPNNKVMIETIAAFGATPIALPWSDTPTALQTGTVNASDNGTSVIKEMKFYQYAKYLVILDHFMAVSPLFASERFMSGLSPAQRKEVEHAAQVAGAYQTRIMLRKEKSIRRWLHVHGGMIVERPDRAPFIAAAQKVQKSFAKSQSAEFRAMLSKIEAAQ